MEQCDLQLLSAYYDGEISPAQQAQIEAHLNSCAACRAELAALSAAMELVSVDELPALNRRELDETYLRIDLLIGEAGAERRLFRLGLLISGLAASFLVISIAWLEEMPVRRQAAASPIVSAPADWERIAVTLLPDPIPDSIDTPLDQRIRLANAEPFANWMVNALATEGER